MHLDELEGYEAFRNCNFADRAGMLSHRSPSIRGWTVKVDGQKGGDEESVRRIPRHRCGARGPCDRFFLFPGGIKARRPDHRRIDRDPDLLWFCAERWRGGEIERGCLRIRRMQREAEEEEEHADEDEFEEIPGASNEETEESLR